MKQRIAIMTEWAWCQNALQNNFQRERFAKKILALLLKKYRPSLGNYARAYDEILRDVDVVCQKLSYGGRDPANLHPLRRAELERQFSALAA